MYDVIVIGARCAGAPTAMLLARKGYGVLAVDRATFPSDTLSTHQIQIAGGARLKRWGLLDAVRATNCPPASRVTFDIGPFALRGAFPSMGGVDAVHSPRRTVLDAILVNAARDAGAEVREGFAVDEIRAEGGRVVGIRGRARDGAAITERGRMIVGADGRHSLVARAVGAATYHAKPALSCAYYAYYTGVPLEGGELYSRERRAIGAWPTNDGLTMIYTAWPVAEFHEYRADIEGNFLKTIALAPSLAGRVRRGTRAEHFRGIADLPNFYRKPYGPGWALVGDAGYHKDPITGWGISDAFRDADLLADAIDAGLSGHAPMERALAAYERRRNAASGPIYEFTTRLASFAPPTGMQLALFEALRGNPAAMDRFFGVLTGVVSPREFFAPGNLIRIMGVGGMLRGALGGGRAARQPAAQRIPPMPEASTGQRASQAAGRVTSPPAR